MDTTMKSAHSSDASLGAVLTVIAVLAVWALWVALLATAGGELAHVLHELVVPGRMGG